MSNRDATEAASVLAQLHAEADPGARTDLADRYGIHTDHAVGVPMGRLKAIAKPLAPNHELAAELWASGLYEARTIAAFVDDPADVDAAQMTRWCADFDNWAIVDTVCFNLFDRSPDAWSMVEPWATEQGEFTKRAGFALLWALAHHDRNAPDDRYRAALSLLEANAGDDRHLITKAQTMALRAIGQIRPNVRADVVDLAQRLTGSDNPNTRRVGRPIVRAFEATP